MKMATRTRVFPILALAAFALAGCNSQDDKAVVAKDASVEDVAKQVAKTDTKPRPGRWESRMQITKFEMAGVPAQMQGMMKSRMGKEEKWISCLTPEQANAANGDFFKPENDKGCKYNTFKMGGGKIEADMTCAESGSSQNMKMAGTYASDAYDMQMNSESTIEGSKVSMAMTVSAKRLGECDGTEPS